MRSLLVGLLMLSLGPGPAWAEYFNSRVGEVLEAERAVEAAGGRSIYAQLILDALDRGDPMVLAMLQIFRLASYEPQAVEEDRYNPISETDLAEFDRDPEDDEPFDYVRAYEAFRSYELERLGVPSADDLTDFLRDAVATLGISGARYGPQGWAAGGDQPFEVTTQCASCQGIADRLNTTRQGLHSLDLLRRASRPFDPTLVAALTRQMRRDVAGLHQCEAACSDPAPAEDATLPPEDITLAPVALAPGLGATPGSVPRGSEAVCLAYPESQICAPLAPSEHDGCAQDVAAYVSACTAALAQASDPLRNCVSVCSFRAAEARLSDVLLERVRRSLGWAAADGFDRLIAAQQDALFDLGQAQSRGAAITRPLAALSRIEDDLSRYAERIARGDRYWRAAPDQPDGLLFATCRGGDIDVFEAECRAACAAPGPVRECRGGVAAALLPGRFAPGFDLVSP